MTLLEQELGRRLTTKQVSNFLGLDEDSVRKHYQALGGIRPTGPNGRILFFEKNIVDALRRTYAFEDQEARTNPLDGQSPEGRDDPAKTLPDQSRSAQMGSGAARRRLVEDRHGIFPG